MASLSTPLPKVGSIKARLKSFVQSYPVLWRHYRGLKLQWKRFVLLRCFMYDIVHTFRYMHWAPGGDEKIQLTSELIFQYHKIEKGLVMPGPKRLFGLEPVSQTMMLLERWGRAAHCTTDPVYAGALEALRAYRTRVFEHQLDREGRILPVLDTFLAGQPAGCPELRTPRELPSLRMPECDAYASFASLAEARRSVRNFSELPVPTQMIENAVRVAQLSPSACNRQPCRLYLISEDPLKTRLLSHQNGNRGFGHVVPHVAVIVSDEACFFDSTERHEPYIDGGLFAMSLAFALRAQGIGSCCLNWCVKPETDRAAHALLGIRNSERIIMLMAIGFPAPNVMVPRSPRKVLSDVLIQIQSTVPAREGSSGNVTAAQIEG